MDYKLYGGAGEIWTLAPVSRPTPLAGAPLQPLEYYSITKWLLIKFTIFFKKRQPLILQRIESNKISIWKCVNCWLYLKKHYKDTSLGNERKANLLRQISENGYTYHFFHIFILLLLVLIKYLNIDLQFITLYRVYCTFHFFSM